MIPGSLVWAAGSGILNGMDPHSAWGTLSWGHWQDVQRAVSVSVPGL